MGASPPAASQQKHRTEKAAGQRSDLRHSSSSPGNTLPTTITIKSEQELGSDVSEERFAAGCSTYGVQSLNETIHEAESSAAALDRAARRDQQSAGSAGDVQQSQPRTPKQSPSGTQQSSPNKPFLGAALLKKLPLPVESYSPVGTDSAPPTTPRSASMRSLQLSEDDAPMDDSASQAIASSNGDEGDPQQNVHEPGSLFETTLQETPQLVMPSVLMPSRKPFTKRGKHVGKLKILVTGKRNTGKTSLIRSIVQTCDDVVHVDADKSISSHVQTPRSGAGRASRPSNQSKTPGAFTEVLASTRAYPPWLAEGESSRLLKRTKSSSNDTVLERNISFIDTPGFSDGSSFEQHSASILHHIKNNMHRNASPTSFSENELIALLSGNGGTQVDLVLYLICGRFGFISSSFDFTDHSSTGQNVDSSELSLLRQLSLLTNIVPVIARADEKSAADLDVERSCLFAKLAENDIDYFNIFRFFETRIGRTANRRLPCVSSAPARDEENIDASLLMSSGYVQPLEPSDLQAFMEALFDPETAACLRHNAVRKLVHWGRTGMNKLPSLPLNSLHNGGSSAIPTMNPLTFHQSALSSISMGLPGSDSVVPSAVLVDMPVSSTDGQHAGSPSSEPSSPSSFNPAYQPDSYTIARLADHTQREERNAQIRLARWATDLQRALRAERARFAELKQVERTAWLQERLEESINVDDDNYGKADRALIRKRSCSTERLRRTHMSTGDPLGLLEWRAKLSERGIVVAKVVGGAGIVGAVAVWVMRTWGWGLDLIPETLHVRSESSGNGWWRVISL